MQNQKYRELAKMLIASQYFPSTVIDYLNICQMWLKITSLQKIHFFFLFQGATFLE